MLNTPYDTPVGDGSRDSQLKFNTSCCRGQSCRRLTRMPGGHQRRSCPPRPPTGPTVRHPSQPRCPSLSESSDSTAGPLPAPRPASELARTGGGAMPLGDASQRVLAPQRCAGRPAAATRPARRLPHSESLSLGFLRVPRVLHRATGCCNRRRRYGAAETAGEEPPPFRVLTRTHPDRPRAGPCAGRCTLRGGPTRRGGKRPVGSESAAHGARDVTGGRSHGERPIGGRIQPASRSPIQASAPTPTRNRARTESESSVCGGGGLDRRPAGRLYPTALAGCIRPQRSPGSPLRAADWRAVTWVSAASGRPPGPIGRSQRRPSVTARAG